MSSASSYYSTSSPSVDPTLPLPQPQQNPSPHDLYRQRPPAALHRASPRGLRDLFNAAASAMADGVSRRQPTSSHPVPSHRETFHDVDRALRNANRALQNAQEAFQARGLQGESEARLQLVDLTAQPSPSSERLDTSFLDESHFIAQTTHPHDPSSAPRLRRLPVLDEPFFLPNSTLAGRGYMQNHTDHIPTDFGHWIDNHSTYTYSLEPNHALVEGRLPLALEEDAINRQRQNHQNWERTQARTRHRRRVEHEQRQSQVSSQVSSQDTMPRPSSSARSTIESSQSHSSTPPVEAEDPLIESIDLTAVDNSEALSATLAKQREDAILAQNPGTDSGRTSLTAYKCPVCMDTPTDATSTICGHVFCHRCIVDTLKWSIATRRDRVPPSRKVKGVCPVCRKPLDVKDTPGLGRGLIPLELKLLVRKRKREDNPDENDRGKGMDKGKGKSLAKAETLSDDEGEENSNQSDPRTSTTQQETADEPFWDAFIHEEA